MDSFSEIPVSSDSKSGEIGGENLYNAFLRDWEASLAAKQTEEAAQRNSIVQKALQEKSEQIAQRNVKKQKRMETNRAHEQAFLERLVEDGEADNKWQIVARLVDLQASLPAAKDQAKAEISVDKDLTRMKQIMIRLKAEPLSATRAQA